MLGWAPEKQHVRRTQTYIEGMFFRKKTLRKGVKQDSVGETARQGCGFRESLALENSSLLWSLNWKFYGAVLLNQLDDSGLDFFACLFLFFGTMY